jgi:copper(I)-binding protein
MIRFVLAAAATASLAGAVQAHEVKAGSLTLGNLAVRASLGAVPTSAAYLTIDNAGDTPDRLLSVDCACATSAMVHRTQTAGGVSSMDMAGAVVAPAHGRVALEPNGLHIMLMGVKSPLKAGGMQEMTLRFEHAGVVKAGFHIKDVITADDDDMAKMPGMADMPGMKH